MHCYWIRHAPIESTGRYTGQSDVDALIPAYAPRLPLALPEDALWFCSPLKRAVQTTQWMTQQPVDYNYPLPIREREVFPGERLRGLGKPGEGYRSENDNPHPAPPPERGREWIGRRVQYAHALMEQHFGAWEGRYYDEVWQEAQHTYDWSQPASIRPPGGESFLDVCARVDHWLGDILLPSPACGRGRNSFANAVSLGIPGEGDNLPPHLGLPKDLLAQAQGNPSSPPRGRGKKVDALVIVAHAGVIRAGLRHTFGMTPAQALSIEVEPLSISYVEYDSPCSGRLHWRGSVSA